MSSQDSVRVRRWRKADTPGIVACHKAAYPDYPPRAQYQVRWYDLQRRAFPEGQFLAEVDGEIVGYATSIIVQLVENDQYTYDEITGAGTFTTHDPSGDTLYGADIAVRPDWRGRGIAGRLYDARKRLVQRYNLRRMVAYGRLPGFPEHSGKMTAEEYVEEVVAGRLSDPALNAHLKAGYTVKRVLLDFVPDRSSLNYATMLEWNNPRYNPEKRKIAAAALGRPVRQIRVCAAQYLMRRIDDEREFEQTVEFFADVASAYHCHFLLLPELFTSQLLYTMPAEREIENPMLALAEYAGRYRELLTRLAARHELFIIGGTTPVERDGKLFNVAHLVTPAGNVYTQDKLHITPTERNAWKIQPGEQLRVFDTPFGRIGILICYDVEFPELVRLLAKAGVEVLFVPFSTDEKKGYNRVRLTARARAVENYLYVVLAGNAGNLPSIRNYLLNFAQSAVFTPSDFAFPQNGIAGEADPNVENVVIADLDLVTLQQQRELGTVRPFFDLRPDLYRLEPVRPIDVVRVE